MEWAAAAAARATQLLFDVDRVVVHVAIERTAFKLHVETLSTFVASISLETGYSLPGDDKIQLQGSARVEVHSHHLRLGAEQI